MALDPGIILGITSIILTAITAIMMWRQTRNSDKETSIGVEKETRELLQIQVNIKTKALDNCEECKKDLETDLRRLRQDYNDLLVRWIRAFPDDLLRGLPLDKK